MCKQTSLCSVIYCNRMPSVDELFWSSDPSDIKYAERARRNVIPAHCYSSVCFPLIIRNLPDQTTRPSVQTRTVRYIEYSQCIYDYLAANIKWSNTVNMAVNFNALMHPKDCHSFRNLFFSRESKCRFISPYSNPSLCVHAVHNAVGCCYWGWRHPCK